MKRFLLIISILLSVPVCAGNPGRTVSKTRIATVISECSRYEGAELVKLGRISTAAIKGVVRIAAAGDPDAREALGLMKGIRRMSVLEYDDCSGADKARISGKLESALSGSEMLMEASDEGEKMRLYGLVDEKTCEVRDFILYSPSECALICIFGSISLDAVSKIASND